MLRPVITDSLKNYSRSQFFTDISAGIIVGIVAVPLCIAFAIAAGVSPEKGLLSAFISSVVIAFLGGSRFQITGPTGAFAVILCGAAQRHGFDGLAAATLMAGVILIIMGVVKLGAVVRFIPYPVVIGFTGGVGVIIFTFQISDLLGLHIHNMPSSFTGKWAAYAGGLSHVDWQAAVLSGVCVLIMIFWQYVNRRMNSRIPGALFAILFSAAAVPVFGLNVETIGSRFGEIPSAFSVPVMPQFDYAIAIKLFLPALSIAMLCAIEGLLSAAVADSMTGTKHRSNMELVAFGAANILSPLFGGIAVTGAVARTAANIRSGGRTPVAGLAHAIILLLVVLCLGRWVKLIPLCALAAVLVMVAYGMSEWRKFAAILKRPSSDIAVLITTFILTLLVNLTAAVLAGGALAALIFAYGRTRQTPKASNQVSGSDRKPVNAR
jgi:SulP family sulfate permease